MNHRDAQDYAEAQQSLDRAAREYAPFITQAHDLTGVEARAADLHRDRVTVTIVYDRRPTIEHTENPA